MKKFCQMSKITELKKLLSAPVIVAPMFLLSNPKLALAVCSEGFVGTFPAHCTRTRAVFEEWLKEMEVGIARLRSELGESVVAPYAVNLVVHATNERMVGDLELVEKYKVPIVITSKSSPGDVVKRIHDYGGLVMSDIATRRHAEKASQAGVDALIAVTGGAGGHTGRLNPFALMNEIREVWDGPTVLAGAINTGRDVLAAEIMGADFAYIGTRFINSFESDAEIGFQEMIIESLATDVYYTAALDGAPANFLTKSLIKAGIDLDELATALPGKIINPRENKKWKDIWSAGQGVGTIHDIQPAKTICQTIKSQYQEAKQKYLRRFSDND